MITASEERLTLYGQCPTIREAEEFIQFKMFDGWKVLVQPFPVGFHRIPIQTLGGVTGHIPVPCEWGFVLHKFHLAE